MAASGMPDDPLERFWYEAATDLHAAADRLPPECTLSLGEAGELLLDGKPMSHWRARGVPFNVTINGIDYLVRGKEDHYDSHSDACAGLRLSGMMVPIKRRVGALTWTLEYAHSMGDESTTEITVTSGDGEELDIDEDARVAFEDIVSYYSFPYYE